MTTRAMARMGSAMSNKQLARTVIDGRLVTFRLQNNDEIKGYLCGLDDFHWMVITPRGKKHLVHKGSASVIDLADDSTYPNEESRPELEEVVGPFRRYVETEFFGRHSASASDERAVS